MLEFRLLGPVEVWIGAKRLDTGMPRQRTVLAALLADVGHVVAVETLVDRVWGEEPPRTARHSLYPTSPGFGISWRRRHPCVPSHPA